MKAKLLRKAGCLRLATTLYDSKFKIIGSRRLRLTINELADVLFIALNSMNVKIDLDKYYIELKD